MREKPRSVWMIMAICGWFLRLRSRRLSLLKRKQLCRTSCVPGSTFAWTGSNGSNGTGLINDVVFNVGPTLMTVNYTVIPTASGCVGPPLIVSAEIDTLPVIEGGLNDTIEPGVSTQLNASGGLTYFWTPSAGLSCINCNNPLATPLTILDPQPCPYAAKSSLLFNKGL